MKQAHCSMNPARERSTAPHPHWFRCSTRTQEDVEVVAMVRMQLRWCLNLCPVVRFDAVAAITEGIHVHRWWLRPDPQQPCVADVAHTRFAIEFAIASPVEWPCAIARGVAATELAALGICVWYLPATGFVAPKCDPFLVAGVASVRFGLRILPMMTRKRMRQPSRATRIPPNLPNQTANPHSGHLQTMWLAAVPIVRHSPSDHVWR